MERVHTFSKCGVILYILFKTEDLGINLCKGLSESPKHINSQCNTLSMRYLWVIAKYTTNHAFPFKDSDKSTQNHNVKKIETLNLCIVSTIGVYSLLLKRKRRVLIKKHSKPSNSWQPFSVLQMLEAIPDGTMEQNRILFSFLLQFIPRLTG